MLLDERAASRVGAAGSAVTVADLSTILAARPTSFLAAFAIEPSVALPSGAWSLNGTTAGRAFGLKRT